MLVRLAELDRPELVFLLDGHECRALEGDTLMTAILAAGEWLRRSEFGDGPRAGFCWMGACQDCTVWIEGVGSRRACTTPVESGMRVRRLGAEH